MKSKHYFVMALCLCSALFSMHPTFAQRVKPTLPEPDTIRAGEYYYLWNEGAQKFMGKDYSNSSNNYSYYKALTSIPDLTVSFSGSNENCKIIQSTGYCFNGYNSELTTGNQSYNYSEYYFTLHKQEDGTYTIKSNYRGKFVAPSGNREGARMYTNITDSTYIMWRLIPADSTFDATIYARMYLYLELEKLDSTFNVEPYDAMLVDSTVSAEELIEAAKEIRTMASTTNSYQQMSWSDYKIQFINDDTYPWTYNESTNRFEMPGTMYGDKTSIKAIVDVDVDEAVLVYEPYTYTYAYNSNYGGSSSLEYDHYNQNIYKHNDVNVYIDGQLVRSIKRDQIANLYSADYYPYEAHDKFFEKITKGVHTIEWEYLRNNCKGSSSNNYWSENYGRLSNIGVMKTPTVISVSLLEPGSLGTEILAQVNSVLEVRKLKIKGEMNAEDWKTIDLITQLVSLDLSEAIITEIPDEQFYDHPWLYEVKLPEGLTRIGNSAFRDCYVDDIKFPSTLTIVGEHAFKHSNLRDFQAAHTQLQDIGQHAFANCRYLKNANMPTENMGTIGLCAFANDRHLENVSLPKNTESIGKQAFYECQRMRTLTLPEHLDAMGTYTFYNMDSLRSDIIFPEGMTNVPNYSFYGCDHVNKIVIPNCVTSIGDQVFGGCSRVKELILSDSLLSVGSYAFSSLGIRKLELPKTLKNIYSCAFQYADMDTIAIPENTVLSDYAFYHCDSLKYAELPTSYYNIASKYIFTNCNSLNRIKIKSPTLLHGYTSEFVSNKDNITIVVPDYLVNSYKLDSYWYTYKDVEGFGTSEVDTWTINNPVTLGATSRFQGSPNVIINKTNLTVNGETGMELNDLNIDLHTSSGNYYSSGTKYYYNNFNGSTQILSSADIIVNGEFSLDYYTYANKWAYIALPFDIRVGDIVTDAQYAIRYYDGANRATTLTASGNWKNYTADDIIPAGTGFVYQTSKSVWNTFVAYENTNKNRALAAKDLVSPLDANACETSAHRGWNLVGNPWMTYFNIHAVDFTAPITVYDQYYSKYQAYSIIDDNVALHPTQAFFVQCPDDISSITFPARGRQLTSVVTDQNGARSISTARRLVDVELSMGDVSDKTRVVMNDNATLEYDYGSDAGKFFAEEEVVQLYTVGTDGTCYAINERPTDDCTVQLAYVAPTAGDYTLSMPRNQAGQVVLKDLLLDTETPLTQSGYTFTTDAGTCADRFQLLFTSIGAMGIEGVQVMPEVNVTDGGLQAKGTVQVYTSDGRLAAEGEGFLPLQRGFYVVRAQGESKKVVIK